MEDKEVRQIALEGLVLAIMSESVRKAHVAEAKKLMKGVPTSMLRTMIAHSVYSTGYGVTRLSLLTQLRYFKHDGTVVLEYDPLQKLWYFGKPEAPDKRRAYPTKPAKRGIRKRLAKCT